MPRFAILRHESPRGLHWDLLLEQGGVLRTWALPQLPEPGVEMLVDPLPDHRLVYLEYEGPVSGDRGSVTRWDAGIYEVEQDEAGRMAIRLHGQQLCGQLSLCPRSDLAAPWRLVWTPVK